MTRTTATHDEMKARLRDKLLPKTLEELVERFRDEAMRIDPTVTGAMICLDQLDNRGAVLGVMLTRERR